jgi:hypothetical protein
MLYRVLYKDTKLSFCEVIYNPCHVVVIYFNFLFIYAGVHLLLTNMGELLFDDIFRVERVNPDGKKFDKGMLMESWRMFTRICS